MATVKELLRAENDGTLSFGDYTLASRSEERRVGKELAVGR